MKESRIQRLIALLKQQSQTKEIKLQIQKLQQLL